MTTPGDLLRAKAAEYRALREEHCGDEDGVAALGYVAIEAALQEVALVFDGLADAYLDEAA